jgi:O-antigen/teichoic acid export membrane protein
MKITRDRLFRVGSEAIWVLAGQVGIAVGALIGVKILTNLLTPYEFGRVSIASTIIILIGSNLFGPLGQGLMRYWTIPRDRVELSDYVAISSKYIRNLTVLTILAAIVSGCIISLTSKSYWAWVFILALGCGAFTGWSETRQSILMAARDHKQVAIIKILGAFAKPIIAAALLGLICLRADIALVGFFLAAIAIALYAESRFRILSTNKSSNLPVASNNDHDTDLRKAILSFSTPFFVWSLFAWAHQFSDKWAILSFYGSDTVGAYSVISQMAIYPLAFGAAFLSNFMIPIAYERAGWMHSESPMQHANRVLIGMAIIFMTGAITLVTFFYFFHRPLILLVSNPDYVQFSDMLPLLTAAWSLYYLGSVLSGFGFLAKKPNVYMAPVIVSGVLTVITTFLLGYKFNINGVISALCTTGLIYCTWCFLIAKKLIASH